VQADFENDSKDKGDDAMRKIPMLVILGLAVVAASSLLRYSGHVVAAASQSAAVFDSDGRLKLPDPGVFRRWVFVGAPLTPEGLNDNKAGFPEYHNVYIEEKNVDAYLRTGSFPEGTVIVKELTRVLKPTFPDSSRTEPSGRGYFNGEFNGMDVTVKDSKRFAKTNGWGFFTFGHHPLPYDKTAAEKPVTECAGCHLSFVSKTDMTWIQFYPILRDKDPQK
jgi:Cytochrome P460